MKTKAFFIFLMIIAFKALSFEVPVRYVYDGDTIMIRLDALPHPLSYASVRISGIDTPEIRGKCDKEKELAKLAKAKVQELIGSNKVITLSNYSHDKFGGRINASVNVNGKDIATEMVASGLARSYSGGARSGWCK